MMRERLINAYCNIDNSTIDDFTLAMMANVENALLSAGATPNVDYTYRDLLKAVTPIVADQFRSDVLTYAVEWD